MARDLWLTRREVGVVDKLKQSLTIGANTYQCGPVNGCYELKNTIYPLQIISAPITLSATTITFDFWGYTTSPGDDFGVRLFLKAFRLDGGNHGIRVSVDTTRVYFEVTTTTTTYIIDFPARHYQWARYTIAADTANNKAYIYINAKLEGILTIAAGNFSAATNYVVYSSDNNFLSYNVGYVQEIALFNTCLDANAVKATEHHKGANGYYSSSLIAYWKLRTNFTQTIGPTPLEGLDSFTTTTYAPIKFGGSFIVAQYEVTLDYKISFKFPITKPDGVTGCLVVRWTDDDGIVQRRKFWELEGVEIYPTPAIYNGEPVGNSFVLEWWNIDGETYVTIPEDFDIFVSITTSPTTTTDTSNVSLTSLTVRTLLAASYSLTFPINFNQQQIFTS